MASKKSIKIKKVKQNMYIYQTAENDGKVFDQVSTYLIN